MSKFIKVANKKIMVKVNIDGIGEKWTFCTPAVKTFAEKTFKEGDIVNVTYETKDNGDIHVSRIEKGNGKDTTVSSSQSKTNTNKPTCKDCGKELKDAKYEKCYACNQKNPSYKKDKGSEVNTSIKRQAIGHMVSRTLIALTGQLDRNSVPEVMEVLYKKYQELVG